MIRALKIVQTLLLGSAALIWTGAGETSDPLLADRAIPADVLRACVETTAGSQTVCETAHFERRWVAKSEHGDIFILSNPRCVGNECRAWLIEQNLKSARTLLHFDANFRLYEAPRGYPVIESYTDLSATEGVYSRYEWNGKSYVRSDQRQIYNVDGNECGTRAECRTLATEAFREKEVDRAVRIWEQVDGVSWI